MSSTGRRSLLLLDDNDTLEGLQGSLVEGGDASSSASKGANCSADEAPTTATAKGMRCSRDESEPAADKVGLVHLLNDAASCYASLLHVALAPVKSSLAQMQHLVKEVGRHGVGSGRSLLQSSPSCGDLGDMSQTPNATSSIVSSSPPDVTCNLETITAETVIMANILGAVASTASAVTAMQVR